MVTLRISLFLFFKSDTIKSSEKRDGRDAPSEIEGVADAPCKFLPTYTTQGGRVKRDSGFSALQIKGSLLGFHFYGGARHAIGDADVRHSMTRFH